MKWLKPSAPILVLLWLILAQSRYWQDSQGKTISLSQQPAAFNFAPIESELSKIAIDENQRLVINHKTAARLSRVSVLMADSDQQRFEFLMQRSFGQNRAQQLLAILASYQNYRTWLSKRTTIDQPNDPQHLQAKIEAMQVEFLGAPNATKLFSDENKIKHFLATQQQKYLQSQEL